MPPSTADSTVTHSPSARPPTHLQREEERKAAAAALLAEVAAGNADLAERKRAAQRAEAEEALRIAEYIRARDAREQARRLWGG